MNEGAKYASSYPSYPSYPSYHETYSPEPSYSEPSYGGEPPSVAPFAKLGKNVLNGLTNPGSRNTQNAFTNPGGRNSQNTFTKPGPKQ